ncbi:HAMP domain-containing histidine kinase [Enterococcus saccharolyticus]|uniref:sensor histidine kinase n=1 Tax=Enterococcus saccharolyticus TaxID=41997 RepID=UPI001E41E657|nr:HAMP domain-containing sensor histidine kinase [Enterococcus saccharolyticus]MCD5001610.1 HAMP domain-containing histidine kinase [Enterococcus saccharolyticus]
MKKWREIRQGAQYQLTSRFVGILLGLLFVVNVAFVSISLYTIYDYLTNQAEEIFQTLEDLPQETSDWEALADATIAKSEDDAIRFVLADGPTYYSAEGKEIFSELAKGRALPIFKGVIVAGDDVYYFQQRQQVDRTIELAIHGNMVIEMVSRMLVVSLFLNIFAIIIGSAVIYFFVGKWSRTLQQMTQEMKEIETTNSQEKQLTVPVSPREMQQVATSFNHLLVTQRQAMARESQFVTDASHELRTPLAAIRGHVQLIKRRGKSHPEVILPSMEFIDKESKRLETLANQLLVLGRTTTNHSEKRVDFSKLVKQEIEKLQTNSTQIVTFSVEENIHYPANEIELQQVCQNLLDNARKYSSSDATINISLRAEQEIVLEVQDTGMGIPDEAKEKIFERFFRIDQSRSSQVEGSGVGLAIVAAIVDKYQGEIIVTDNHPKGSIFTVKFPRR